MQLNSRNRDSSNSFEINEFYQGNFKERKLA